MQSSGVVTLTTDFGLQGSYVAQMKGVILMINPDAVIVDVSHEIPPQDIRKAAFFLMTACRFFPRGTVHLAVVDPGVGGRRKALLVQTTDGFFLGPDNGVLSLALHGKKVLRTIAIINRKFFLHEVSQTFHGRDIFAPVAAYVTRGIDPAEFGRRVARIVRLKVPKPTLAKGMVKGEVIHCDTFGNLITNIHEEFLMGRSNCIVVAGGWKIRGLSRTYSDAPEGQPVALIGSSGFLEVCLNRGSTREALNAGEGMPVLVLSR